MAQRLLLLHIGPDTVDVSRMTETLGEVAVPDVDAETLAYAGLEIRRTHRAAGVRRKQVEGAWARVCRRAWKARSDCFVSMPAFFDATPEQAALALDGLSDFAVVLVVTGGFTATPPASWTWLLKAERIHLLPSQLTDAQLGAQVARIAMVEREARIARRLAKVGRRRTPSTGGLAA